MIRRTAALALLALALTGCAALLQDARTYNDSRAGGMAKPVMEPAIVPEAVAVEVCEPDDDGIGGTGCPVK